MKQTLAKPFFWLVVAVLAVLTGRLAMAVAVELYPDEALYVLQSEAERLQFGPHPPAVTLQIQLGLSLFGKTELGVRFSSLLFGLLALIPIYLLARGIGGPSVAFWTILAVLAVPVYSAFAVLGLPDSLQLFLWSLALYLTYRALRSRQIFSWILIGLCVGLGLYVKYTMVFYFPSLLVCLLLTPKGRASLRSPGPYLAALIAFLVFVPVAAWQDYSSGWTALRYHLSGRHVFEPPSLRGWGFYQFVHLVLIGPLIYPAALLGMVWAGMRALRNQDEDSAFLFSFSAVTCAFFAAVAPFLKRESFHEHWDATAYVPALIAAVLLLHGWFSSPHSPRLRALAKAGVAAGIALGLVVLPLAMLEMFAGTLSQGIGKQALFGHLIGWKAMAREVDRQLADLPGPEPGFVLSRSHYGAVEYWFYGWRTKRVYAMDHHVGYKQGAASVIDTSGVSYRSLGAERGRNAIFVTDQSPLPGSGEKAETDPYQWRLGQIFSEVEELPPLEIVRQGRILRRFRIYRCLEFDDSLLDTLRFGGPQGNIDRGVVQDGSLVVEGWAADPSQGAPVQRVEIRIDKVAVGQARLGLPRPDVRAAFGREDFLHSGWRFETDIRGFGPGEHRVTAVAVTQAGDRRQLLNPPVLTIPAAGR